jgi:hypothetical protein
MRALSIRQPYAELILRGIKTIEYRSRPTRIIGEEFYIYAALKPGDPPDGPAGFSLLGCQPHELATGLIVGTAMIARCARDGHKRYEWHLAGVKRLDLPAKPANQPQPIWFWPF